jgi:hypothetical protein
MEATCKIHGGWGNHIEWCTLEEFQKQSLITGVFSVWGHLPRIPAVDETVMGEFTESFMKFVFISVKRMEDPADMFFGKVRLIEVEPKDGSGNIKVNMRKWFNPQRWLQGKYYCKKI